MRVTIRWRKSTLLLFCTLFAAQGAAQGSLIPIEGLASWYGESHRGRIMANGEKFDPEKLTAASWFFPLGTRVKVCVSDRPERVVCVTITDRGPARRLVREGRVIDLSRAAFEGIAPPQVGLIRVAVEPDCKTGNP